MGMVVLCCGKERKGKRREKACLVGGVLCARKREMERAMERERERDGSDPGKQTVIWMDIPTGPGPGPGSLELGRPRNRNRKERVPDREVGARREEFTSSRGLRSRPHLLASASTLHPHLGLAEGEEDRIRGRGMQKTITASKQTTDRQ